MNKRQGIVRQRKGAFIDDEKNKITTRVEQKSEPIGYDAERSSSPTCSPQDNFFGSKTRQEVPFYGCDCSCFGGLDIWLVTIFLFWGFGYPLSILSTLWETRPYRQLGLNGLRPE